MKMIRKFGKKTLLCRKILNLGTIVSMLVLLLVGCGTGKNEAEDIATEIVKKCISASVEEAEAFEATMKEEVTQTTEDGSTAGLISIENDKMVALVQKLFDNCLTEECAEQSMANRTCLLGMTLAKQHGKDVIAKDLEMKRVDGESESYTFTAKLYLSSEDELLCNVSGSITMEYEDDMWKAAKISTKL